MVFALAGDSTMTRADVPLEPLPSLSMSDSATARTRVALVPAVFALRFDFLVVSFAADNRADAACFDAPRPAMRLVTGRSSSSLGFLIGVISVHVYLLESRTAPAGTRIIEP